MPGAIKRMIDDMIEERSRGDAYAASSLRVKLLLKGIDPEKYTAASDDDPVVMSKLQQMRDEFRTQGGGR